MATKKKTKPKTDLTDRVLLSLVTDMYILNEATDRVRQQVIALAEAAKKSSVNA